MVGQGVLRECLQSPDVESVLSLVRSPTGQHHPKLTEQVHADFTDYAATESAFAGIDACYFCLGISASSVNSEQYRRITYDYTLAAAQALLRQNPNRTLTFIYVSGEGTNAKSRLNWARVKGETENALLALPFKAAYMFRPGVIVPLHGIRSRTAIYRLVYDVLNPILPTLESWLPNQITTTEKIGQAMLNATRHGAPVKVLANREINALAATGHA